MFILYKPLFCNSFFINPPNRKPEKKRKLKFGILQRKMESFNIEMLPSDCVSKILSLTTPSDTVRSSLVSPVFRSAADSDVVWDSFLPINYAAILAASDIADEFKFSSKRELFLRFCSPLFLNDGNKSFSLERFSGKISYVLSARELAITWGSDPLCWSWKNVSESRFREVAELRRVSRLEIQGKIRTQTLSPNTLYGAYILIKISDRAYGLDLIPTQVSVEVGNRSVSKGSVYLQKKDSKKQQMECLFYGNRRETLRKLAAEGEEQRVVREREDGWMEIEMGEFFCGETDEEIKMSLMEIKGYQLKAGVVVEGIELRPKH